MGGTRRTMVNRFSLMPLGATVVKINNLYSSFSFAPFVRDLVFRDAANLSSFKIMFWELE